VFRFDSRLFYANASCSSTASRSSSRQRPTRVRWLILDCSSIGDIDYSASLNLEGLIEALHEEKRIFALADVDPELLMRCSQAEDPRALRQRAHLPDRSRAVAAFQADSATTAS
jgi:MFS superfamily sulfate permease-like transporter